jgi:lysophospholipase L1-like esterase
LLFLTALTHIADKPEPWDFKKHPAADIVVINIGTNDQNQANNVSTEAYIDGLTKIIQGVHGKWPKAQVVVMVSLPLQTPIAPEPS